MLAQQAGGAQGQPGVRVEGPPPGLASGRYDVPRWSIIALGTVIVLAGCVYLVVRVLRSRRGDV
jgi:hypothetical protein